MSRDIKFRFVDETDTIYGPLRIVDIIEQARYCTKHPDAIFVEAKNKDYLTLNEFCRGLMRGEIITEQYTGLDDRNGEEIYEGDIIEEELCTDGINETTERYKVEWNEHFLNWYLEYGSNLHSELWETNKTRKIIGNIHENPELLKGERTNG